MELWRIEEKKRKEKKKKRCFLIIKLNEIYLNE